MLTRMPDIITKKAPARRMGQYDGGGMWMDAGSSAGPVAPFLGGVPEQAVGLHGVLGAPPGPGAGEVARGFQVGDDGLDRAFREAGNGADVADPRFGVAGNLHENAPMAGQQRPAAISFGLRAHLPSISSREK